MHKALLSTNDRAFPSSGSIQRTRAAGAHQARRRLSSKVTDVHLSHDDIHLMTWQDFGAVSSAPPAQNKHLPGVRARGPWGTVTVVLLRHPQVPFHLATASARVRAPIAALTLPRAVGINFESVL